MWRRHADDGRADDVHADGGVHGVHGVHDGRACVHDAHDGGHADDVSAHGVPLQRRQHDAPRRQRHVQRVKASAV